MRYRDPKKESDLFSMIEHQQSVLKTVKGINKLNALIDWELFREELESILFTIWTAMPSCATERPKGRKCGHTGQIAA